MITDPEVLAVSWFCDNLIISLPHLFLQIVSITETDFNSVLKEMEMLVLSRICRRSRVVSGPNMPHSAIAAAQ